MTVDLDLYVASNFEQNADNLWTCFYVPIGCDRSIVFVPNRAEVLRPRDDAVNIEY